MTEMAYESLYGHYDTLDCLAGRVAFPGRTMDPDPSLSQELSAAGIGMPTASNFSRPDEPGRGRTGTIQVCDGSVRGNRRARGRGIYETPRVLHGSVSYDLHLGGRHGPACRRWPLP
jgi:hypothetical protein